LRRRNTIAFKRAGAAPAQSRMAERVSTEPLNLKPL
jgi:hypothetical protein